MNANTLNKQLAIKKSVIAPNEDAFTRVYQAVKKPELTTGLVRTYTKRTEDGEQFPQEQKKVTLRIEDAVSAARDALCNIFNVIGRIDATNMTAKADIVVDEAVLVRGVPAVHLLFLEKRCISIIEFISALPTLNEDASWRKNEGLGLFETDPTETLKTKKLEKYISIAKATPQFAEQTAKVTEDVVVGAWSQVLFSGAVTLDRKKQLLGRAEKIQRAVKVAREEANQALVVELSTAPLVDFIFA